MGLFKWFGDSKGGNVADDPVVRAIVSNVKDALNSGPHADGPDEHMKRALMEELTGRISAIRASAAPITECRELLLDMAQEWAHYYVLLLGPPPISDPMGMLGQQGVTGELRPRILDAIKGSDEPLREEVYRFLGDAYSSEEAIIIAEILLWRIGIWLQAANSLRMALGDRHQSQRWDWIKPLLHAECAVQEAVFRDRLGMPSALATEVDPLGGIALIDYAKMQEFVRAGHQFPDKTWRECFESEIAQGILLLPSFSEES